MLGAARVLKLGNWLWAGLLAAAICTPGSVAAPDNTGKAGAAKGKPGKPVTAAETTGKVTVFYPKPTTPSIFGDALRPDINVMIDGKLAGAVNVGKPLTVMLSPGPHKLGVRHSDALSGLVGNPETPIAVSLSKPLFFYVHFTDAGPRIGEADAVTAQAEISGLQPKTAAGSATVFVFWPRALLDFGLFDAVKQEVDVTVDGRRIGAMGTGDYVTATVASGRHALAIKGGFAYLGGSADSAVFLTPGKSYYYRVSYKQYFELSETTPEQGGPELSKLRQR
jgi:hypothetical protein